MHGRGGDGSGSVSGDGSGSVSGDEAAWRELIAHYDVPAAAESAAPWPDAENVAADSPERDSGDAAGPDSADAGASGPWTGAGGTDVPQPGPGRIRIVRHASPPPPAGDDEDAHYVPPPPPPLPRLDSIAKGAWAAVCGGPAYLLAATIAGWQVSGWSALLAVAAFVGGFAVVVLRMDDGASRGDDSGAVL